MSRSVAGQRVVEQNRSPCLRRRLINWPCGRALPTSSRRVRGGVRRRVARHVAALEAASDPDCAVANVSYRRDCALSAYACPAASRRSGAEVEIIGELDAGLRLACANARTETAAQPHFLAQGPYRCSVKWGSCNTTFRCDVSGRAAAIHTKSKPAAIRENRSPARSRHRSGGRWLGPRFGVGPFGRTRTWYREDG